MAWATITPKVSDSELYFQDINELISNAEYLYSGFDVQHNPASGVHEAITATSFNKLVLTAPATSATLTLADGSTLATAGAYSTTLTATGTTTLTLPTSGTLATTSNKLSAFAATTSAELAGVISDETGTGALVFADSPVLTTKITVPLIVTASGALTLQPASGSGVALTLATTGDFSVNTSQLYVDTSAGRFGVNTTTPVWNVQFDKLIDNSADLPGAGGSALALTNSSLVSLGTKVDLLFSFGTIEAKTTPNGITSVVTGSSAGGRIGDLLFLSKSGVVDTSLAERMRMTSAGRFGFNTTAPDKQVEINSATGDCLRLTYNDANGSAAYYADLLVSAAGDLTIAPVGNVIVPTKTAPANAAAAGVAGTVVFTDAYIYRCIASGNWVRVAIATWV
jgi:hypothetical protein